MKKGVAVLIVVVAATYFLRHKIVELEPVKKILGREKVEKERPAAPEPAPAPATAPSPEPKKGVEERTAPSPAKKTATKAKPGAGEAQKPKAAARPSGDAEKEIQGILAKGDKVEARKALTRRLLAAKSEDEYQKIKKALDDLNKRLFFSRSSAEDAEFHVVEAGDTLYGIAKEYGSTPGLIMWANDKQTETARLGERLKVPVGTLKLLVDRSDRRLIVLFNNQYIRDYPVGVGKENRTPVGTFVIDKKIKNPPWYTAEGKVIPYGHPDNILGTRWMGFKPTAEYRGFGIHGTTINERVGKALTSGCICMFNKDAEDLFRAVPYGCEVVVRD